MADVFHVNISKPSNGVKLLGGPVSLDIQFCSDMVKFRANKTVHLMNSVKKLKDPQSELLLLRNCTGVSKLYFTLRTTNSQVLPAVTEHYDQQLLGYLHHIVTDDGARFGILQQRLATLPFKEGGFEVYTMADASHYCYMASQIQKQHLQNTILSSIDTSETSHNYQYSLNKYMQVCDLSTFSTNSVSPHPIKALAAQYFDVVKRKLPTKFTLTTRDAFLWQSNKLNHVMDFLKAIPIPGLGQSLGPRQFRVVAQYRLGIPLFPEDSKCSCCGRAMDVYGDHALHCASEVGIKFRHNLVRDLVMDICYRSGVAAGKEVALGFLSDNNNALKPADILIYNWENGQDTCFDVTGVSPFSSGVIRSFIPGHAISAAVTRKCN